ncbi:MAG: sigma-54-dependent Fis family transcriptional regulator [Candidatus Omnitrophota bacterium]|jgi:two-component system NtrC family response regulator|nr:MAG: sigma-54-dependent Fis family transcriptional regulator [Candidatus Omnitrophota bacterium]
MPCVLVIDDDEMMCCLLAGVVSSLGHEVQCAKTLTQGLKLSEKHAYDVVFLDVGLPDGNGLDILPHIRGRDPSPEVIIITGHADSDGAELAIKSGAWDYIEKGSSIESITLPFVRALQFRNERLNCKTVSLNHEGIIGASPKIRHCLDQVAFAANSETNILITGESGTGKELFAWAIHNNSLRSGKNFVVVDCAALPETLIESLLFGHEKGAFTGADKAKDGLILQADGGTLFLDEVGELSLPLQKAFLRVLQEHRFRPVGGEREYSSDFRLVSATNKDLESLAAEGRFREDLLFRLRAFQIDLPPLRERKEDILKIALYHLSELSEKCQGEVKAFSPDFLEALAAYSWPGNIRELYHALDRAYFSAQFESRLYPQHLPDHIRIFLARKNLKSLTHPGNPPLPSLPATIELPLLRDFRHAMEKEYLLKLLAASKGNIPEACRISGLSRSGLYTLLQKHQIFKDGE